MGLDHVRARAATVVLLSSAATTLLVRISLARIWAAGEWHDPPALNVIVLGVVGAAGIACGARLLIRADAASSAPCMAWAAAAVALGLVLAILGHESGLAIALLALAVGAVTLNPTARGR
jgi:hypothetical protein